MAYKDPNKSKEYYAAHKEEIIDKGKAWYQANKEARKASMKAWKESNREQCKEYLRAYRQAHKEQIKANAKAYYEANKEHYKAYSKAYKKSDLNVLGQTKQSIRYKSQRYLNKYGTKIPGYQIHHCCTYTEPYKFIYCSKEMHRLIHAYLRQHNISADSDHYAQIKHLLDDTVVLYGLE